MTPAERTKQYRTTNKEALSVRAKQKRKDVRAAALLNGTPMKLHGGQYGPRLYLRSCNCELDTCKLCRHRKRNTESRHRRALGITRLNRSKDSKLDDPAIQSELKRLDIQAAVSLEEMRKYRKQESVYTSRSPLAEPPKFWPTPDLRC